MVKNIELSVFIAAVVLILLFSAVRSSYASYVIYNTSAPSSTYFGSVSSSDGSFSYSDASGNSIGYSQTQYIPVIVNTTGSYWIRMQGGNVPSNAIVLRYINGYPIYYCRVQIDNRIYYGELVINRGCFIGDESQRPYNVYETLVR